MPQGCVLSFICTNNLCVTAQQPSFVEVETTIEELLSKLTQYYRSNNLRANPDKTQVTEFHLRNKEAKRMLKVNRTDLENTPHPKYLGVTLDGTLICKQHIHKMKMATRNNLLRKLSSSKWGTNTSSIRTTLSYSVAEYTAPVWVISAHAYKLDSEVNSACQALKRQNKKQIKPTLCTGKSQQINNLINVDEVYVLSYKMNKTTCMFDPFPTRLLFNFPHLFIDVIVRIINLTCSTASFLVAFKSAVVKPIFKKIHLTAIF